MGRFAVCISLIATLLTSCAWLYAPSHPPAPTLTDAQLTGLLAEVQNAGDECRAKRLSGRLRGFVASVQCSNPRLMAAYLKVDYPDMPLLDLALARRLQLAERADEKKISEGDMLVEFFSDVRGLPATPPNP